MRMVGGFVLSALLVTGAQAADYLCPIPEPAYQPVPTSGSYDWSGFYVGGGFGYGNGRVDPTRNGPMVINSALPNLEITDQAQSLLQFQKGTARGTMWSVFGGYNTQWDDVIVGVEGEFTRTGMKTGNGATPDIMRTLTGPSGNLWDVGITGVSTKTSIRDYGVMRMRFGVAYDRFMPFMTMGVALGNLATRGSVTATAAEYQLQPINDPVTGAITGYTRINLGATSGSFSRATTPAYTWGYAVGAGIDIAFTDNIFARGTYEYVGFGGNNATAAGLHTVKAGIGTKF